MICVGSGNQGGYKMVEISKGQDSEQGAKQPGGHRPGGKILFSVPRAESRKTRGGFVDPRRAKTVDVFLAKNVHSGSGPFPGFCVSFTFEKNFI